MHLRKSLLAFVLASVASTAHAGSETATSESDALVPKTSGNTDVEREVDCIRLQTDGKEPIKTQAAKNMINVLGRPLEDGFERFKLNTFERALFYSQAIEETGGFTQLTESKTFENAGASPLGQLAAKAINDEKFKEKKGARASKNFGQFRGHGLFQISRCDNFVSIAHYLNKLYNGDKAPTWKANWEYETSKGEDEQLGSVCTPKQLSEFRAAYAKKYGRDPNIYGVLEQPVRFAMIGSEFVDPVTKRTIDSERFMVDASLAFWRGKCGAVVKAIKSQSSLSAFERCADFKGAFIDRAVQCLTQCVKGSTEGWERRSAWMKTALLCARGKSSFPEDSVTKEPGI